MKCPNCGAENQAEAAWCYRCLNRFDQAPAAPRRMPTVPQEGTSRGRAIVGGVFGGVAGLEAGLIVGFAAALALDRFYFSERDPMTNLAMGLLAYGVLVLGGASLGCAGGASVGVRLARRWPPRVWRSVGPAGRAAAAALAVLFVSIGPAAYMVAMQREATSHCDPGNRRLDTLRREPIVRRPPPGNWRSLVNEDRADEENGACSGPEFFLVFGADSPTTRDDMAQYYAQLLEGTGWVRVPGEPDVIVYEKSFGAWEATATLEDCFGPSTPGACFIEVVAPPAIASN